MSSKKTQAALEFIMTYGWAILVSLIAVVVLAYYGILDVDRFVPQRCMLPSGIACLGHNIENHKAIVVLQNAIGRPITLSKVSVSNRNYICEDNSIVNLGDGGTATYTLLQCNNGESGSRFNGVLNITYTIENELSHKMSGTIYAIVTEGSPISSQNICQNAQDNELCEGLDIVYGAGYREACCNEYALCCG